MSIDEKALDAVKEIVEGNSIYNLCETDLIAMLEAYEVAKSEQPVESPKTEVLSFDTIRSWGKDPKVHDAVCDPTNPFSVAWHKREDEHRRELEAVRTTMRESGALKALKEISALQYQPERGSWADIDEKAWFYETQYEKAHNIADAAITDIEDGN